MSERPITGRWFEDLTPGLVVAHAITRTITEADNTQFSTMTMNPQPLHLDATFAAETEFAPALPRRHPARGVDRGRGTHLGLPPGRLAQTWIAESARATARRAL
jgi:hypothetical protein